MLDNRSRAPVGTHVGKARELRPELGGLLHRPGIQLAVIAQREALAGIHAVDEAGEIRFGYALGRGAPDFRHVVDFPGASLHRYSD